MDRTKRVTELFNQLIEEGEEIKSSCKRLYFMGNKKSIDPEVFSAWKTSCLSLLKSTFGSSSPHFATFTTVKFFDYFNTVQIYLGILKGARTDLEKGFFFHKDLMLSVNILDSFISRAQEWADEGQIGKGVVVLETTLQEILTKICENKKIHYRRKDAIPALARKLAGENIIPEQVRDKLLEIQELLRLPGDSGARPAFEDFRAVKNWMLEFLYEYLGSQILILN